MSFDYPRCDWGRGIVPATVAHDVALRYVKAGDYAKAASLFYQVTELEPEWAENRYQLGLAYIQLGEVDKAEIEQIVLQNLDDKLASKLELKIQTYNERREKSFSRRLSKWLGIGVSAEEAIGKRFETTSEKAPKWLRFLSGG